MAAPQETSTSARPHSSDEAKAAALLLDLFGVCENVASILEQKLNTIDLARRDAHDILVLVRALGLVHSQGRTATRKVSRVPFLLKAYKRLRTSPTDECYLLQPWTDGFGRTAEGEEIRPRVMWRQKRSHSANACG